MVNTGRGHAPEERLESYVLGQLPEEDVSRLEEHLLVCPGCREKLEEVESFIAHFRPVAAELREQSATNPIKLNFFNRIRRVLESRMLPLPFKAAAALAVVAVAVLILPRQFHRTPASEVVSLQAVRGVDPTGTAAASSEKRLELQIDLTQLPPQPSWNVEIVDSAGNTVSSHAPSPAGNRLSIVLERPLPRGTYFVRLYGGAQKELLREYGLLTR